MPSVSKAQKRLMDAVAHGWRKPGGGGPSVSVAKDFVRADKVKAAMNTARRYAKRYADGGPVDQYTTQLTPDEQAGYQSWKQQYAPRDSGYDYDLQGAYKAGFTPDPATNHFDDRFKKPNHPTFSIYSQYAKDRPDLAGTWEGKQYIPPVTAHYAKGGEVEDEAVLAQEAREAAAGKVARKYPLGPSYQPTPPSTENKTWMMEPDLQESQMGELPHGVSVNDAQQPVNAETGKPLQIVRRPGVLPIASTPDGPRWTMPKALDVAGNAMPSSIGSMLTRGVPVKAGEMVLGAGATKTAKVAESPKAAMSLEDEIASLVKGINAPKAEAKIAAKADDPHAILDTRSFQPLSESQGTMPGGWRVDPSSGDKWYVKEAPSIQQAANEKLTAELYKASGVPVADVRLTTVNGKPGIASKAIEGDQLTHATTPYNEIEGLHDNYVFDAVFGNHDAVGTGPENPLGNIIVDKNGVAHRIDTGGGLSYKGTGQPKTAGFGHKADELSTMKDPNYSHLSADVFSGISDEALQAGAQKLLKVDPAKDWWPLIQKFGPKNEQAKVDLFNKLASRRNDALERILGKERPGGTGGGGKPVQAEHATDDLSMPPAEQEWTPPSTGDAWAPSSFGEKMPPMKLNKTHSAADYVYSLKDAPGLQSSTKITAAQAGKIGDNLNSMPSKDIVNAMHSHDLTPDQMETILSWLKPAKEKEVLSKLETKIAGDHEGLDLEAATIHPSNINTKPYGKDIYSANRDPLKDPEWTAQQIIKSNRDNPHDIAHDFYDIAMKNPKYADEVFKHIPPKNGDDLNANLGQLIERKGIDPWSLPPEAKLPLRAKISQHFQKMDWQSYRPHIKPIDVPIKHRKAAEEADANVNVPLWKSGNHQDYPKTMMDPKEKPDERAFFVGDDPAKIHGGYGSKTMPYYAHARKAYVVDYKALTGGQNNYQNHLLTEIIEEGHRRKADVIVIKDIHDPIGGLQDQYAFLNTAVLRAPGAKFAKDKLHLAHPLLGVAGGGLFSYEMLKGNKKEDTKMARGGSIAGALKHAKRLASGGDTGFFEHSAFKQASRAGMIHSPIPGRTDKIPMGVKGGSYVMPADVVSGLGQGNSTAGAVALNKLFGQSPYGAAAGKAGTPKINYGKMGGMKPPRMRADGGDTPKGEEKAVPVIVAGGEYLIDPETVTRLGGGDIKHGHEILDNLVLHLRKKTIKDMQGLAPPKKS